MAGRKYYTVKTSKAGLNVREEPSKDSKILKLLPNGARVNILSTEDLPTGWAAIKGGGYVMTEFLTE